MSISERVQKSMAKGSWIRKMFEVGASLKQQYGEENVFDLTLGNPVMEPPAEFHRELRRLEENPLPGMHRYMQNAGYSETRAAVAVQLSLETGIKFTMSQNEYGNKLDITGIIHQVLKIRMDGSCKCKS